MDPTGTGEDEISLPTFTYTNEPTTSAELAAMLAAVADCKIVLDVCAFLPQ
ncbi:MAG: hypothetical protein LKE36_06765 [Bacilli bacterium]|jgi:hypothetical protein|nr:hypothetical protein [Bacilli bacterium]